MAAARTWWSSLNYTKVLYDQSFGMIILDEDLHNFVDYGNYRIRPRTKESIENSGVSRVIDDEEQFKATLDVSEFTRDELKVRRIGNIMEVHGHQGEKTDSYGIVRRQFVRKYFLPAGVVPANVKSSLDNGILTIQGRKENVEYVPVSTDGVVSEVKIEVDAPEKLDVDEPCGDTSTTATS